MASLTCSFGSTAGDSWVFPLQPNHTPPSGPLRAARMPVASPPAGTLWSGMATRLETTISLAITSGSLLTDLRAAPLFDPPARDTPPPPTITGLSCLDTCASRRGHPIQRGFILRGHWLSRHIASFE